MHFLQTLGLLRSLVVRFARSAVFWAWIFNVLRLASGILLLPLLLLYLSESDLGMYYVFLGLVALLPMVDSTFALNLTRYVGYAMGGAVDLRPQGTDFSRKLDHPNYPLIWSLLSTTMTLYRWLAILVFIFLGVIGTGIVSVGAAETSNPALTWTAWGVTLIASALEIYLGWWNAFLRGMNQVVMSSKLAALGYGVRLVLASMLLILGLGLLSVPIATLLSSALHRTLSRRACLRHLHGKPQPAQHLGMRWLWHIVWPNSWRVGLALLSHYFYYSGLALLCLWHFGLEGNARYGLSLQIMQIILGMAGVWTHVKWPEVVRLRATGDLGRLRRLIRPRIWLQSVTFVVLALLAISMGPHLLDLLGTNKEMLPRLWLALLALNTLLELHFSFWTVLLSTENRLPSLWPTVATNLAIIVFAFLLLRTTSLGLPALVLAPFVLYSLFNYWYWPIIGARSLGTSLGRFLFRSAQEPG